MKDFQGFFKLFTFFVQKVYLVLSKASNNNFFGLLIVTQLFLISSVNHKENTQFFLSMGCLATLSGRHEHRAQKQILLSKTVLETLSSSRSLFQCILLAITTTPKQNRTLWTKWLIKARKGRTGHGKNSELKIRPLFTGLGHILSVF